MPQEKSSQRVPWQVHHPPLNPQSGDPEGRPPSRVPLPAAPQPALKSSFYLPPAYTCLSVTKAPLLTMTGG